MGSVLEKSPRGSGDWQGAFSIHATNLVFAIGALVWELSFLRVLRSGPAVEGVVISMFDDGVYRQYEIYFEAGTRSYQLNYTAKCKKPAGAMQIGDTVTLILRGNHGGVGGPVVLFPKTKRTVLEGTPQPSHR